MIIKPIYTKMESVTQAEEDVIAGNLTGQSDGSYILFNSTIAQVRIWDGAEFQNPPVNTLYLATANNLSDLGNVSTARGNILPSKTGNTLKVLRVNAGETDYELSTIAAGGDLLAANNLSDLANAGTSRNNLGLGSVTNTSDEGKPVSTAQQTALDLKANLASPTFTGTVGGITKSMVGLGSADNTTDAGKPVSSATQTALNAKQNAYTFSAKTSGDIATGANVTPVTLTGLVFNYEANATYRIWFMGRVTPAAATTGCGFQFDLSSAVTEINVSFYHQLANTGTLSGGHSIADDASVGVSSGLPGTSTYPVVGNGILVTTGNTGTAQLRFRSETTAVITAKANFAMVVEKII